MNLSAKNLSFPLQITNFIKTFETHVQYKPWSIRLRLVPYANKLNGILTFKFQVVICTYYMLRAPWKSSLYWCNTLRSKIGIIYCLCTNYKYDLIPEFIYCWPLSQNISSLFLLGFFNMIHVVVCFNKFFLALFLTKILWNLTFTVF